MIEPSFPKLSVGLMNQLLQIVGRSGKTDAMMKVILHFPILDNMHIATAVDHICWLSFL